MFRTHRFVRQEKHPQSDILYSRSIVLSPPFKCNSRYILSSTGQASPINDLVGLLEFTEDELLKAQKGLDAAGITLPNFKNVSRELAKEPTPEPEETEDERIKRELHDHEQEIVGLQAVIRGNEVRSWLQRKRNRLRRAERDIVALQSFIRGQMVRALFVDHLRDYRTSVEWATRVIFCSIPVSGRRLIVDPSYREGNACEKGRK